MACCGLDTLEKVQFIVAPKILTNMALKEINGAITAYLRPKTKLVIAERTNFYSIKQLPSESIMDFTVRLRQAVQFCKFDELKTSNDPTVEMVLVALIAGLITLEQKTKVL